MFVSCWVISDTKDDGVGAFTKGLFTQIFVLCKSFCVRMFKNLKFHLACLF